MEELKIKGAREHNLKNVNLTVAKNQLIVFSGISGSGKSSLAFDTIYAEGQRRYVESLSSYARQFLGMIKKPDVDIIEGLSPAISIDQKSSSHNPRSTVGTVTEIYDYLRLLFARIGHPHCPKCGLEIAKQSPQTIADKIVEALQNETSAAKPLRVIIFSPVVRDRKGEFIKLFENLRAKGYTKARIDGTVYDLADDNLVLIKTNKHSIDVVVDRLSLTKKQLSDPVSLANVKSRIFDAVSRASSLSAGLIIYAKVLDSSFTFPDNPKKTEEHTYSERFSCPVDNISFPEIEPRTFSFNSPHGACPTCNGLGSLLKINENLILNPRLTISEGGILPLSRAFEKDTWYARLIKTVCSEYDIDLRAPLSHLSKKQKTVLLYGVKDRDFKVAGTNRFGEMTNIYETFAGIIPDLEKRHTETDSDYVRAEIEKYMFFKTCPTCLGARLKKEALSITVDSKSIVEITKLPIDKTLSWAQKIKANSQILTDRESYIGATILNEIIVRLKFLDAVGLDYLTLDRTATTLAGGEAQRIRLASQIGSGLTGVLYVLDEPSIGLHQRDNQRLIHTLKKLKDLGNTVIIVEHDKDTILAADVVVEFGPGAGDKGGKIIAQGTPTEIMHNPNSVTGPYLSGKRRINLAKQKKLEQTDNQITIAGCCEQNLKNITVTLPLDKLICITGVSGSGKSTFLETTLFHALASQLNPFHRTQPGKYAYLRGLEHIKRVSLIDQSPIGRTPRSNPATYTAAFNYVRELFAMTPEARSLGFGQGYFSFNVKGGRCEACEGEGQIKIEMQFMSDIYVTCEICGGKRYNQSTLEVTYKGKNIAEVLEMTIEEAVTFFQPIPALYRKLSTLNDVGLNYMKLGQPAPTLSGGEAQRVKLATELSKSTTSHTVYLLDEPTTGLHFADLEKLLRVLQLLVDKGNTVVVIEHNLDVIKNADWIIDLGPEGGEKGGYIVAEGAPSVIAKNPLSHTGIFLKSRS